MELHQVRYFAALCNTLNFTRAAEACNVTQPALTRAIQRLEEELDGPLFQRERNLTQLTELGRLMRPLLEQTLAAAEAAKAHASRFRKNELASLRLGLPATISARVVAGALAELMRRIPSVEVEFAAAPQEQLVERLLQGALDAALLVESGEPAERLNQWRLFVEGYRVAFHPEHRFAALAEISADVLIEENLVARRGCVATASLQEKAAKFRHLAEAEEHIQQLAAIAAGVALVPAHLPVMPGLESRPLNDQSLRRGIVLAVVNGRRHSPALDTFIKLSRARDLGAELDLA